MESELINLMHEGMSLKDYDEEWFDNFFEIYTSSIPLTADEQEVLAQLLAHGYLKEWRTDFVEIATCYVEPDFDLWMKAFKLQPEGSLGGFYFYQLLEAYHNSKFGLPSDIRWYEALLEYSDDYGYGDEPEEAMGIFEAAFNAHKNTKFRKAIINIAYNWVADYSLNLPDYYDSLEADDYSDNFNHGENETDEFAKALILEADEADSVDLYDVDDPVINDVRHPAQAPVEEQPLVNTTPKRKKFWRYLIHLIGISFLIIFLWVCAEACYYHFIKKMSFHQIFPISSMHGLGTLILYVLAYLFYIGAFKYLYRYLKRAIIYSIALFNAVFFPKKGIIGRKLHLYGYGPENVRFNHLNNSKTDIYPMMLVPKIGTYFAKPILGKNCKRGPGEQWLALWIKAHGLKGFYDNQALRAGSHRYEPDLAYIDEQHGIYIDIENDEPYTMGKRIPTHYLGKDDQRNNDITAVGWIVLRFSEKQCLDSPARVARTVMDVVRSISPDVEMPRVLQNVQPVDTDPRWDYDTARQHAKSRYRDSYMNKHLILRLGNLFFK